jgi:ribosomal-protein-alanine N-acetyltransferase
LSRPSPLPILSTDRLILRVPTERDAEMMAAFARDNRQHFAPWDPERPDEYFTPAYWKRTLVADVADTRKGTHLQFIFVDRESQDSTVVGQCTLSGITRGVFQAAYMGYGLDHRFVGRGLMSEALRAVIDYCFGQMNLHRIMANTRPENERSLRTLERLGFVREGYAHRYLYLAGAWRDHVLMTLINPDWKSK